MFNTLQLTNFRQHADLTINFAGGLNAVRGPNESGKTTGTEALRYALFGAVALRSTFAETVTWGQKESTLKVAVNFEVNGTTYDVRRSKAGAELDVNGRLTVTGQKEVTRYVESLLGCTASTALNLMLADQSKLRGALTDGPAATVALIESLANFSLIDEIITLVQEKLPNGNTLALQASIANHTEQLEAAVEDCRVGLDTAADKAATAATQGKAALASAKAALDYARPDFEKAVSLSVKASEAAKLAVAAQLALTRAEARVEQIVVPDAPDVKKIPALEKALAEAAGFQAAQTAHNLLQTLPEGDEWDEGLEALEAEISVQTEAVNAAVKLANEAKLRQWESTGRLIKETHCAFCDKDLADVPEVATRNEALEAKIATARTEQAEANAVADAAAETRGTLEAVRLRGSRCASIYQKAAAYITLDHKYVPARWTWTGPDLEKKVNTQAASQLATLRKAVTDRAAALGRAAEAAEAVQAASTTLVEAQAAEQAAKRLSEAAEPARQAFDAALYSAEAAEAVYTPLAEAASLAQAELQQAQVLYDERLRQRKLLTKAKVAAEKLLEQTNFNNVLLKKLRGARPVVADKLWGSVLHSVSAAFSAMRGTKSVVTKAPGGFQVDGQGVDGLSGSTLDILGLAIRIALTKTFLPNSRFLILDEASAACDDEREASMVAAVAGADFDQVIWLTHSDAVEALAANVIQL